MGYRSDVVITIGFKTQEELDTFLAPRLLSSPLREWREYFSRVVDSPNCVMFQLEDVKWYEEDSYVRAVIDLCRESVKCGGAYKSTRLGESDSDIEVEEDYGDYKLYEGLYQLTWVKRIIHTPSTHELTFGE